MTYPVPPEAFDDRLAVFGTAGAGKTYLTIGAIARLLDRSSRVIAIDPLGVMWGLRSMPDGNPSSYKPVIFGGEHGDLPLNEHAGALIGETAATMRESCILDLSALGTKAAERRFMLAFLTSLYKHANKDPVHLVFDEADMWAPQKLLDKDGDAAKLLGMMETVVRRGRVKGFVPWLVTQRPAVLSKDVLSQADGVVALKLTAKQDKDAFQGWIEGQADSATGREILASLPSMRRGQGVVWIPGRSVLDKSAQFPANKTFDSSRTPMRGEAMSKVALKPLDVGTLQQRIAAVVEQAKANDPAELRRQLATAHAELAKLRKSPSKAVEKINTPAPQELAAAHADGFAAGWAKGWPLGHRSGILGTLNGIGEVMAAIKASPLPETPPPMVAPKTSLLSRSISAPAVRRPAAVLGHAAPPPPDGLTSPQARILASLAFWKGIGHNTPTREQVAAVAAYKPGSGNFNNLVGGLSTLGHTRTPSPGRLELLTPYPLMDRDDAQAKLWSVFDGPQKKLVRAALEAPGEMGRDDLATAAGYAPGSGNFNNITGSLTSMDVLTRPGSGRIALSDWAREVLA